MKKLRVTLVLLLFLFVVVKGKISEKIKFKPAFAATFPNIDPPTWGGSKQPNSKPPPAKKDDKPAHKAKRESPASISTSAPVIRKSDLLNGPSLPIESDQQDKNNATEIAPQQGRSSIFGAVAGTAVSAVNAVGQTIRNWAGDGLIGNIGKGIQGIARSFGKIQFLLFTPKTREFGELMTIQNAPYTSYDRTKEVIFIIHGFTHASYYDKATDNLISMLRIKDGFINANFTSNIIIVDWTSLSSDATYIFSSTSTASVADEVSDFIIALVQSGITSFSWVRLVGHSLGAHVSGITGSKVIKKSGGHMLARIDGLDPAGPNFDSFKDPKTQVSSDDAAFVHIIHCNIKMMGSNLNRGSVDFYPNGGDDQSGCDAETLAHSTCNSVSCSRQKRAILGLDLDKHSCNHVRCIDLYIESLTTEYKGCKCPDWRSFLDGTCICQPSDSPFLGYYCDETARGMYFLKAPLKSEYEKYSPAYVNFFNTYGGALEQKLLEHNLLPEHLREGALHRSMAMPNQSPVIESIPEPKAVSKPRWSFF